MEEQEFLREHLSQSEIEECILAGSTNMERMEALILKIIRSSTCDFYDAFVNYFMNKSHQYKKIHLTMKYGNIEVGKDISTQTEDRNIQLSLASQSMDSSCLVEPTSYSKLEEWDYSTSMSFLNDSHLPGKSNVFKIEDDLSTPDSVNNEENMLVEPTVFNYSNTPASTNFSTTVSRALLDDFGMDGNVMSHLENYDMRTANPCKENVSKVQARPSDFQSCLTPLSTKIPWNNHSEEPLWKTLSSIVMHDKQSTVTLQPNEFPKINFSREVQRYLLEENSLSSDTRKVYHRWFMKEVREFILRCSPLEDSDRRLFFRQLKIYLRDLYPNCSFGSENVSDHARVSKVLKLAKGCIRQRQYMSKRQLVPKLQRRATRKSISIKSMEISTDELLSEDEVVSRLQQEVKNPNCNLDNVKFLLRHYARYTKIPFEKLPSYLYCSDLVIYEASLRFPNVGFHLLQANVNHLKTKFEKMTNEILTEDGFVLKLHRMVAGSKATNCCPLSFLEIHPDNGEYGPCVAIQNGNGIAKVISRANVYNVQTRGPLEALSMLIAVYYLFHLNYPARYGQVLGCVQLLCLTDSFPKNYVGEKLSALVCKIKAMQSE